MQGNTVMAHGSEPLMGKTQSMRARSSEVAAKIFQESKYFVVVCVLMPGALALINYIIAGDHGCGSGIVYEGCGAEHWWVPFYMVMGSIAFLATCGAKINSTHDWPDIPEWLRIAGRSYTERKPPQHLIIHGSQRNDLNGDYILQSTGQDGEMLTWRKQNSDLKLLSDITDWLIDGEKTGFCGHSLRHHRGRMPHEFDGCWRCVKKDDDGGTIIVMDTGLTIEDRFPLTRTGHSVRSFYLAGLNIGVSLTVGFALPVLVLWAYTLLQGLDTSYFTVPERSDLAAEALKLLQQCKCVIIHKKTMLAPFAYSIMAVVVTQFVSVMTLMAKSLYNKGRLDGIKEVGELQLKALEFPSCVFMALSAFVNLGHLIVMMCMEVLNYCTGRVQWNGLWESYLNVYIPLVNSGAMTLYVTCIYASLLTLSYFNADATGATAKEDYPHWYTGAGLRVIVGYIFFIVKLPPMMTHIWWAMAKWWWLSIPCEVILSLLLEVFLPDASQTAHAFLVRRRRWKTLKASSVANDLQTTFQEINPWMQYFVVLSLLPLHEPVAILAKVFGLSTPHVILPPAWKAFLLAIFLCVKSVELQYFFSLQMFEEFGVNYWDTVTLGYESRHMQCEFCVMETSASHSLTSGSNFLFDLQMHFASFIFR